MQPSGAVHDTHILLCDALPGRPPPPPPRAAVRSVPIMYPIVESFRLVMQSMMMPAFPFNVLGSVLARNTAVMYRNISPDEKLLYRYPHGPAPAPAHA